MASPFKIYVDRLKAGNSEKIELQVSSEFLDVHEKDLSFPESVSIHGETYLTDDHLVVHLKAETTARMPCSVCNEFFNFSIEVDDFYHVEPLAEIKTGFFDYSQELREALLLQVPPFVECNEGNCPERKTLNKFLKKQQDESTKIPTHFPFADLDKS